MPHAATRRHAPRARHAARRAPWRRVLTALVVTFAVILVGGSVSAFVAYQRLNGKINHVNVDSCSATRRTGRRVVAEDPKAKNILVMGSDKRKGKNALNVARPAIGHHDPRCTSPPTGSRRPR